MGARITLRLTSLLLCVGIVLAVGCDNALPPTPTVAPAPTATTGSGPAPSVTAGGIVGEEADLMTAVADLPSPTAATSAALDSEQRVVIYKQVLSLLTRNEQAPVVFLSPYLGEGERLDEHPSDKMIPEALTSALSSSDPDRTYQSGDFSEVVGSLDDGGVVKDNGVYVTLGDIQADPAQQGAVVLRASIYRKVGSAEGYTYRLVPDSSAPSGWRVIETTQDWLDRSG
jgi:hypothetical protein